jgi:hypothetical protein
MLIGFDLSALPASTTVISSTLRLYELTTNASQTITLYRLTNSWVGAQVNWNLRSTGISWSTAGGDYQNTALAAFSPNIANQYRDINVTTVTQGWVNGAFINQGFLLRSSGTTGEVRFGSSEALTVSQRPQLCITYQLVPTITPTFTATIPVTPSDTPTLTPTSTLTSTPSDTPTASLTSTASDTPTPSATPSETATPSNTPTATITSTPTEVGSGNTFMFIPVADAYVNGASAGTNYGSAMSLRQDANPIVRSYLRFNVQGLSGTVTKATLRIFTSNSSSSGYQLRSMTDNSWSEFAVNYTNSPAVGNVIGTSGAFGTGVWTAVDITPLITTNGLISFALTTTTNTAFNLASRETGATAPQLVIETQFIWTPTPSATSVPTDTPTITPSPTVGPTLTPSDTPTATSSPTHTAIPSDTPIPTETSSPTETTVPSDTPIPSATSSPTHTAIPSDTPTATATVFISNFTFNPVADAYVNEASAAMNYGTATTLRADASPLVRSYLRFNVQGLSGSITHVTLRIFTNSSSSVGYEVRNVVNNTWAEGTINFTNAPAMDVVTATSGPFGTGVWTSVDITPLFTSNGTYNIALTTTSGTAFSLVSREAGANIPQLVIEMAP